MVTIRKVPLRRDYHLHTNASDGLHPTRKVIKLLHKHGIKEFAITDHDTVAGLKGAAEYARALGVRYISGIELTSKLDPNTHVSNVHVLGYGFNPHKLPSAFINEMKIIQESFAERVRMQCEQSLIDPIVIERQGKGSLKLQMSYDELLQQIPSHPTVEYGSKFTNLGVMWNALTPKVNEFLGIFGPDKGVNIYMLVSLTLGEGNEQYYTEFQRFLHGFGATLSKKDLDIRQRWQPENYVPYYHNAQRSIALIREAGGMATIAHPGEKGLTYKDLLALKEYGAQGLEVYTPKHSSEQVEKYLDVAHQLGFIRTIGRDFHGGPMNPMLYSEEFPAASIGEIERSLPNCP
jgi:3',5'-nucleoside bisphosphate phosphatase